jgi:hypothetical protein
MLIVAVDNQNETWTPSPGVRVVNGEISKEFVPKQLLWTQKLLSY